MFCQLEVLLDCLPPSVQHTLEDLPDSLDETYERILKEIRKPNQRLAHRLMQCLVAAVRPLQVKELAEVLAFNYDAEGIPKLNSNWRWEDQEGAVMLACSSLVTIVKDEDSRIVQFSHFSVKEFLTSDRLAKPIRDISRYYIELEAAHTIFAQTCIGVLLRLDDHVDQDKIKDFPLARYAAKYWAKHAEFGSVSSRIKDGMRCLFDENEPHFAACLWIYNDMFYNGVFSERPKKPKEVPLFHAAMIGFRDLVALLIAEHPEHVNARDDFGSTAMHAAVMGGDIDILSLLLEHDADVDSRDANDETPLCWASRFGKLNIGKHLLDLGANVDAQDDKGSTPLFEAAFVGNVEIAQMLLDRGAVVDFRDNQGRTPLSFAVEWGNIQVARLLLSHGADVNARDESGSIPSEYSGETDMLGLLLEYGAMVPGLFSSSVGSLVSSVGSLVSSVGSSVSSVGSLVP